MGSVTVTMSVGSAVIGRGVVSCNGLRQAPVAASSQSASPILSLTLKAQSWVQVTAADGRVLESGMLGAGQHDYPVDQVARMVIGNVSAAELRRNGELQDLAAFRRANVARFTVSSDGRLQPAAD